MDFIYTWYISGKDFANLVESTLSKSIPPFQAKGILDHDPFIVFRFLLSEYVCTFVDYMHYNFLGGDLQEKYKSFVSSSFGEVPEEFAFWDLASYVYVSCNPSSPQGGITFHLKGSKV